MYLCCHKRQLHKLTQKAIKIKTSIGRYGCDGRIYYENSLVIIMRLSLWCVASRPSVRPSSPVLPIFSKQESYRNF